MNVRRKEGKLIFNMPRMTIIIPDYINRHTYNQLRKKEYINEKDIFRLLNKKKNL